MRAQFLHVIAVEQTAWFTLFFIIYLFFTDGKRALERRRSVYTTTVQAKDVGSFTVESYRRYARHTFPRSEKATRFLSSWSESKRTIRRPCPGVSVLTLIGARRFPFLKVYTFRLQPCSVQYDVYMRTYGDIPVYAVVVSTPEIPSLQHS